MSARLDRTAILHKELQELAASVGSYEVVEAAIRLRALRELSDALTSDTLLSLVAALLTRSGTLLN